ncbi:MAG: patatin-like phospholipase family protein [Clostridia bacterium]
MKRAIVFGGGGSKGAYQLGAWRALNELGLEFEIATGTSIGSVNAGFYVQHDFEKCEKMWNTINSDMLMKNSLEFNQSIDYYIENRETIIPFIKNYITYRGADISPLKILLASLCDEEKFFASKIDFALMTTRFPSRNPHTVFKRDIREGYLKSWILASSSCFPAFPVCEIDGEKFIDGGYCDNLPVDAAFKLGAETVIAIALKPLENIRHSDNPLIKYIVPSRDLGSFLNFERGTLDKNIKAGYLDTMKAFNKLYGYKYSFKIKDTDFIFDLYRRVFLAIANFESVDDESWSLKSNAFPLTSFLSEKYKTAATPVEKMLQVLETAMTLLDFNDLRIYDVRTLVNEIAEAADNCALKRLRWRIEKAPDRARILKEDSAAIITAIFLNAVLKS